MLRRAGTGSVRCCKPSSISAARISAASRSGGCCPMPATAWSGRSCSSITWVRWIFRPALRREVDVRPHPHIGLSTVTYLFDGEIMHRDSVGSEQAIRPGEVNWMTAGRGITHSERFEKARADGGRMHGIQAWVALPKEDEEIGTRVRALRRPRAAHRPTRTGVHHAADRGRGIRAEGRREDAFADVLCPSGHAGGRAGRSCRRIITERAAYVAAGTVECEAAARFTPGRCWCSRRARRGGRFERRRHRDGAGRRAHRPALRRMEFRLVVEGAHRAGQGRLARRAA